MNQSVRLIQYLYLSVKIDDPEERPVTSELFEINFP